MSHSFTLPRRLVVPSPKSISLFDRNATKRHSSIVQCLLYAAVETDVIRITVLVDVFSAGCERSSNVLIRMLKKNKTNGMEINHFW